MRQIGSPRLLVRALAGAGLAALITATVAQAQRTTPPDQVSRKIRVRDVGGDPNIAAAPEVNVRPRPPAPAGPGNPTPGPTPPVPRAQCAVTVDNKTELIAKAYIDGRYSGSVAAVGEMSTSIAAGATGLDARAEYDDGTADAWGPVRVSCRTKYVWRLAD